MRLLTTTASCKTQHLLFVLPFLMTVASWNVQHFWPLRRMLLATTSLKVKQVLLPTLLAITSQELLPTLLASASWEGRWRSRRQIPLPTWASPT